MKVSQQMLCWNTKCSGVEIRTRAEKILGYRGMNGQYLNHWAKQQFSKAEL